MLLYCNGYCSGLWRSSRVAPSRCTSGARCGAARSCLGRAGAKTCSWSNTTTTTTTTTNNNNNNDNYYYY